MRANREQGEHGTENAGSCSGPNGDALSWWRRAALVCVLALDRWRAPRWFYLAAYRLLMPRIFDKNPD